jgi:hypothetical protein
MKRLLVPALAFALALSSCGTVSNIRYDFASSHFADKAAAVTNACTARMSARELDPIRGKVELVKMPADGPVPFTILTNRATAAAQEETAIGGWAKLIQQCQVEARAAIDQAPVPPEATASQVEKLKSYITDAWIEGAKLRVALYNGELSYADYASKRLSLAEDALKTAERYAQDTDEEHDTHDLEDGETALAPFAALM